MKKMQAEPAYPRSLSEKDMEQIFEKVLTEPMDKEWDDKLQKYLNMMIHSKDKESIEIATKALSKLMKEKDKKFIQRLL